jgi:uncharacterized membrane protein YdjX (TVP38/TMEM64 family)
MEDLKSDLSNLRFMVYCAIFAVVVIPIILLHQILVLAFGPRIGEKMLRRLFGIALSALETCAYFSSKIFFTRSL